METTCPLAKAKPEEDGNGEEEMGTEILPPPPIIELAEEDEQDEQDKSLGEDGEGDGRRDLDASAIPDWLQNEFKESEDIKRPNTGGGGGHNSRRRQSPRPKSSQRKEGSSREYQKRLEQHFNQRQNEIRLEAQNAVRERERALNEEVSRLREELNRHQERRKEELEAKSSTDERGRKKSTTCVLQ